MIKTIIFSKDRPQQLHLLLESINKNLTPDFDIHVLYKYTTEDTKLGYETLKTRFNHNFIHELDFDVQLKLLLTETPSKYTMFLVDDDVFYRPSIMNEYVLDDLFNEINDLLCFSFRLGDNTTWCYTQQQSNKIKEYTKINDEFICWDIKKSSNDYSYVMSLDGHIYKTEFLLDIVNDIKETISNPNIFEVLLNQKRFKGYMSAFKQSALINMPVNKVQNVFDNLNGLKHNYTIDILCDLYNEYNYIIDINSIDPKTVNGTHQEFKLNFKEYE